MKIWLTMVLLTAMSACLIPGIGISNDELDLPPSGSDISNIRCQGKIVGIGASAQEVEEICGKPLNQGKMIHRDYDTIWVYQSDNAQSVHYLAFRNRRLERMYRVSCIKSDPHCP